MRRLFHIVTSTLLLCFFCAGLAATDAALAARPNVIYFLGDDVGYGDVGPFKKAGSPARTPNIDRLASEGMTFSDAHSPAAVCAPTRYSALTGNYPYRGRSRWGTWGYNRLSQFMPGQKTVADVMKAAGYRTGFFGKLHQGGDYYKKGATTFYRGDDATLVDLSRAFRNGPIDHGFQYSFTLPTGIQNTPYAYFENDKYVAINPAQPGLVFLPAGVTGNSEIMNAGYGDANWDSSQAGPNVIRKAVDFIDRHHQTNLRNGTTTPFMMFYASQAIHEPNTPPNFFINGERVKGETGGGAKADLIYEMDLQVGALLSALEVRGLLSNTLFIFTSDNGPELHDTSIPIPNHDSRGGLRGEKTLLYEGGHRVPFIARWGDGTPAGSIIRPGSRSNQLIGIHDWVAAMYALTNQPMPADQARDSANILPILVGQQSESTPLRDYLVLQAGSFNDQTAHQYWQGIRRSQWKLILDQTNTPRELYNVASDLRETQNLVNDPTKAKLVSALQKLNGSAVQSLPRTVPVWTASTGTPNPCGAPTNYTPVLDRGIYLWQDCTTGVWKLRAAAGTGSARQYAGRIVSTHAFTSLTKRGVEANDTVNTSDPKKIAFVLNTASPTDDGFDFTFPSAAHVVLELTTSALVYYGKDRINVPVPLTLIPGKF